MKLRIVEMNYYLDWRVFRWQKETETAETGKA